MKSINIYITLLLVLLILFIINYLSRNLIEGFVEGYSEIREFDNFLTDEECDKLIEMSKDKLTPSMVFGQKDDVKDLYSRKSDTVWLKNEMSEIVSGISDKVAQILGLPLENQEDLQVVKYGVGGFFKPHYDNCMDNYEMCESMVKKSGYRHCTFLIYLNDVEDGGETCFTKLKKCIKPRKGKAVLFYNTDKEDGHILTSEHTGTPVKKGEKWICNKWVHLRKYIP